MRGGMGFNKGFDYEEQQQPRPKTMKCKFFDQRKSTLCPHALTDGYCKFGNNCIYAHSDSELVGNGDQNQSQQTPDSQPSQPQQMPMQQMPQQMPMNGMQPQMDF